MDTVDPDSWFEHEFGPNSAVSDYANDPPRGMTNPPMNYAIREPLCKDLVEYGVLLQAPQWTSSFVKSSPSQSTYASSSPSQVSSDFSTSSGSSLSSSLSLSRAPDLTSPRARLVQSYSENLRAGLVLKKGSIFSRSASAIMKVDDVDDEEARHGHPSWHQYHPFQKRLRPVDPRGPPGLSRSASSSSSPGKEKRTVRFADDAKRSLAETLERKGSPVNAEFIKTPSHEKAIQLGRKSALDSSSQRQTLETPAVSKMRSDSGKDAAKDEETKGKHKDSGCIDEMELDNRFRTLRGASQLHRAAVADRFRFGASMDAGEPMVLRAASLNQCSPGGWSSDAAHLTKMHNSAIRIVAPSGLEVLKEPKKKRKKKKKHEDDAEELKMSDSGLFVARYPIDTSLVSLRRMRRQAFPEEKRDNSKVQSREEALHASAASLKEGLGGFMLSRFRESEEAKNEAAEAAAKSGYEAEYDLNALPA